jgi:DNA ligase-1
MRTAVQLCAPVELKQVARIIRETGQVLIQPKLKGMHFLWTGRELLSGEGNQLPALVHLARELGSKAPGLALEGEAYYHGLAESEIIGLCHRSKPDAETLTIQFHAFDLIDKTRDQKERLARLPEILPESGLIRIIRAETANSLGKVRGLLSKQVKAGFEGIVIRDPRSSWRTGKHRGVMKWKPKHYDLYTIVDVLPGRGGYSDMASALIMADREGNQFKVGGLCLTHAQRLKLWELRQEAKGRLGKVSYTDHQPGMLEGAVFESFWKSWPALSDGRARMTFRVSIPNH